MVFDKTWLYMVNAVKIVDGFHHIWMIGTNLCNLKIAKANHTQVLALYHGLQSWITYISFHDEWHFYVATVQWWECSTLCE